MHLLVLDAIVREWVVAHRPHAADVPMLILSAIGRGGMVWLALGALLTLLRFMPVGRLVSLVLSILLATILADHVLKPMVDRSRPYVAVPGPAVMGAVPHDPSFPSGHAANAFAGAAALARALPETAPLWWALAAAIAYSRVYLGVHYPLDVIAGAFVGLIAGTIAAWSAPSLEGGKDWR